MSNPAETESRAPNAPVSSSSKEDVSRMEVKEPDEAMPVAQEKRPLNGLKWFFFLVSTLTAIFLYALDNTVVANIQPVIVNRFNSVDDLPWLSVGFMIGGLAIVMPIGKLFMLYDGKWLFITFTIIFMAASALCGGAPNMPAEIVGRVFAGLGGNGMYYGLLNLISVNTMERERPTFLSLTGTIWGVGTVLGPVIGGSFELYTWRWAFYINLLFGALVLPAYVFLVPSHTFMPDTPAKTKLASFDYIGAVLSSAGFITFVMATNFGGTLFAWSSGSIIALFVVSGVLWIIFAIQQTFTILTNAANRMFPVHLLKNREALLLFLTTCCGSSMAYVAVYYIPLYFQFTRGDDAIKTSERILPFIFLLTAGMLSNGYLMSRLGYYKPWYIVGSIIGLVGNVLMSRVNVHTSTAAVYGFEILVGLGPGCFCQGGFAVIQATVDPADAVSGVTLMLLAQLCGLALGLSIGGAVFINLAKQGLTRALPATVSQAQITSVIAGTSGNFLATLPEDTRENALEAIVSAMQKVFTQLYVAAAVALVLSLFLKHKKVYAAAAGGG